MPTEKVVTISHDGFARQSLVRRVVEASYSIKPTCSWCGNRRWRKGKEVYSLFEYGTHSDQWSGRTNWHKGLFCSKSCHDAYHNI